MLLTRDPATDVLRVVRGTGRPVRLVPGPNTPSASELAAALRRTADVPVYEHTVTELPEAAPGLVAPALVVVSGVSDAPADAVFAALSACPDGVVVVSVDPHGQLLSAPLADQFIKIVCEADQPVQVR